MSQSKKIFFALFFILVISGVAFRWYEFFAGAEVRQPLEFSHRVHTEIAQCEDCHLHIKNPGAPGLPDIKVCKGCHGDQPMGNSPEEKKLTGYITQNKNIGWKRLYKNPVHVYFSHERHVLAGKLECERCHGAIGKAAKPPHQPLVDMEMSYCISCHNKNKLDTSCVTCHK